MLIYNSPKSQFLKDLDSDNIEDIIQNRFLTLLHKNIGRNEYMSWQNSLREMGAVVRLASMPDDAVISIEYGIPGSGKRIDFIVSGLDEYQNETIVIIELKQWQEAKMTDKDGIVETRFEHGNKETNHPSYQSWSYAMLLKGFNSVVYEDNIQLKPCAFLHNYKQDGIINHEFYSHHINQSPLFLKGDKQKLADFISENIRYGDMNKMMYRIEAGKIRPSKALADSMASMIKGNQEFVMIDDQKLVFETAVNLAKKSSELNKNVLIVEGGPGTGKSVVAINLLVKLTKEGLLAQYVTKNSAPRAVYHSKLTGTLRQTEISNLFKGSGSYTETKINQFDALIVDEAHRLNEKSGMFSHLGENQVKEIIESSKFSIFFIDENQKVTFKDIGTRDELVKWAKHAGAKVHSLELSSQFRCNGSDGYLAWLDNTLQIRETANIELDTKDYDFRVFDNPNKLRDAIFKKNQINNKARLVSGYCWKWASKKDENAFDIIFPEYDFAMKWNLATDGMLWILAKESVNEIGCIHTCQGLEMDYVGVIIGDDLAVVNGQVVTNPEKRAKSDASLKGYKAQMKIHPEKTKALTDSIIKNTYRTLMTRGMKGCYVYIVDENLRNYFKDLVGKEVEIDKKQIIQENYNRTRVHSPISKKMVKVPLVGSAPCGNPLLGEQNIEDYIEVEEDKIKPGAKYFIVRASGDSMDEAGINDKDLLLCRFSEKGETGDRVVALIGGEKVTVKYYDKRDGRRVLLPKSSNPKHQPIIPEEGDVVQGIVQEVINNITP